MSSWLLVIGCFHTSTLSVLLRGGDELSSGRCGEYTGVRVSLSKKKRERHDRADWGIRESGGERQYHCRVPARFRRKFNRVVGDGTRFSVRRLPRGRDFIRGGYIGEVCAADGNLGAGVDFLVLGTAYALEVLHGGANARVVHARPVEVAGLAAQVVLDLCADMNLVFGPHKASFLVAGACQSGVDAKPAVEQDVASVLAECLHSFKETAYDAEVRVKLPSDNVAIVHCEAQTARCVVRFLVDDNRTKEVVLLILWIIPDYHPVVEGRLGSRGYHTITHGRIPLFVSPWVRCPLRFSATRPDPLSGLPTLPVGTAIV